MENCKNLAPGWYFILILSIPPLFQARNTAVNTGMLQLCHLWLYTNISSFAMNFILELLAFLKYGVNQG